MVVIEIYLLLDLLDDSPLPLKDLNEMILHLHIRRSPTIIHAGKHRRRPTLEIERERETVSADLNFKILGIKISFSLSFFTEKNRMMLF